MANSWEAPKRPGPHLPRRTDRFPGGFRSSFRDWAAEQTDHPREVIEAALAHTVPNKVEAAYARSTLLDRRRALMRDWATFLARGQPTIRRLAAPSGAQPTR